MARSCTICTHPERAAIDKALLQGRSISGVSGDFGLGRRSVGRHKRNHLKATLPEVVAPVEGPAGVNFDELIADIKRAKDAVWKIVDDTIKLSDERRDCLAALRQLDSKIELLGKLMVARMQQSYAQAERETGGLRGPIPITEIIVERPRRVGVYIPDNKRGDYPGPIHTPTQKGDDNEGNRREAIRKRQPGDEQNGSQGARGHTYHEPVFRE